MPLRRLTQALPGPGRYAPIGAMNKQLTFCLPGATSSTDGTQGPPSPQFNAWGAMWALAADELDKAQQIAQKATHLAVINYQLNVQESMQIQFPDAGITRTFQIEAIEDPDEMRWQLKVYCFEIGQNAGGAP